MKEPILEMKHISKHFGSVIANKNVNLSLYPGEIHALLGENGAGKSTLMNILTGIYKPDEGEIYYKGKRVSIKSPKHAVELGIGMVHQHFRLIPTLSVAENVYLYMPSCKFLLNEKEMEASINRCSKEFNLAVDAKAKVWQLSVGEQQRVEIVKLLYRGAEILVLDEPSAVLTPQEAEEMFKTLRKMADSGKAVIIISHKMNEVMNHADRITVLKGGVVEDSMSAKDATVERLTRAVIGERSFNSESKEDSYDTTGHPTVLKLTDLCVSNDKKLPAIKNLTMSVHAGEIFGIAGVAGNGQRELTEAIAGLRKATGGRIMLQEDDITRASIKQRVRKGISFVPEDRLHMGLVPSMNLSENAALKDYNTSKYSKKGILNHKAMDENARRFVELHEIKSAGIHSAVSLMSGGNQQKLLIAREIDGEPALIVAAYPVRGLDIGATEAIHRILREQKKRGAAILLVSEELDEIFEICDRVGVLCEGEMMAVKPISETNYDEIGKLMAGERL